MPKTELEHQLRCSDVIFKEPELRAAMIEEFARSINMLSELTAERLYRHSEDIAVRTLAGAIIGALLSVMLQGKASASAHNYFDDFDKAMVQLEKGLEIT